MSWIKSKTRCTIFLGLSQYWSTKLVIHMYLLVKTVASIFVFFYWFFSDQQFFRLTKNRKTWFLINEIILKIASSVYRSELCLENLKKNVYYLKLWQCPFYEKNWKNQALIFYLGMFIILSNSFERCMHTVSGNTSINKMILAKFIFTSWLIQHLWNTKRIWYNK